MTPSNYSTENILNYHSIERRIDLDSVFSFCSHWLMVEWGELSFKVVRLEASSQELLARASNFQVARAAFDTSVSLWPMAEIELRQGARVIYTSKKN
jgi:hypothetical protein